MNVADAIRRLEQWWDLPDGYFYRLRQGDYDPEGVVDVEDILTSIHLDDNDCLPRRFISLTWMIPTFMAWQIERVDEAGGDTVALRKDIVRLHNVLEQLLGVP